MLKNAASCVCSLGPSLMKILAVICVENYRSELCCPR